MKVYKVNYIVKKGLGGKNEIPVRVEDERIEYRFLIKSKMNN